jgi:hypothetical protein
MAQDLKELDLSDLYDLLATYTTQYTHIMRWGGPTDNLKDCEQSILEVQTEIDSRNTQPDRDTQQDNDLDDGLELVPVLA